jgi:hypothetical protein
LAYGSLRRKRSLTPLELALLNLAEDGSVHVYDEAGGTEEGDKAVTSLAD